jgi:glycosyltransferase involved in cell wall biosynthesis
MLALRQKGVYVALACKDNAKIKKKAIEKNIEIFILPFKGNIDFKTLFSLIKIIKAHSFDIVNTHSGKDTWVGGFAAKVSGAKFIRTRHLSNLINQSRLNFINSLANYIFTTGEVVKQDMMKNNRINPAKIKSIPTGIDQNIFNPILFTKKQTDEINIGIVAVLRQFKRHDIFIKMAKIIKNKYSNKKINFLIAGDGPQKENIIRYIDKANMTNDIKLLGHIDNVAQFLNNIDIFTLTSDSKEGVPQSVMQALMMQKAVIATNVGGTVDLLKDENFILIEPDSIDILVEKISLLIDDVELREKYQTQSRDFIIKNFSKNAMADNIFDIYEELLKS